MKYDPFRPDHVKHTLVSFGIAALLLIIAQWFLWFAALAALGTFLVGLWKEIRDIGTTGFDISDLIADLIGIAIALLLFCLASIGGF